MRYEPVHPLLAELDSTAWPSTEQLVGQFVRVLLSVSAYLSVGVGDTLQDLDRCMMHDEPGKISTSQPKGRLDRLILPWNP